jgi:hypothetical protein
MIIKLLFFGKKIYIKNGVDDFCQTPLKFCIIPPTLFHALCPLTFRATVVKKLLYNHQWYNVTFQPLVV